MHKSIYLGFSAELIPVATDYLRAIVAISGGHGIFDCESIVEWPRDRLCL